MRKIFESKRDNSKPAGIRDQKSVSVLFKGYISNVTDLSLLSIEGFDSCSTVIFSRNDKPLLNRKPLPSDSSV